VKGFLIFLAVVFPVVMLSPSFWSLVRMEWGAERIGYIYGTGPNRVTQWATLGPKAPWPQWAVVPQGAKLTVRANYEAAPGHPAIGYGDTEGGTSAHAVADRNEAALRSAGWSVRVGRFDASTPDIPPRPIHWCIVQAARGGRVQQMSVEIDETQTTGALHWTEGAMRFPIGATDRPCWS
jgi:hypothetical protein